MPSRSKANVDAARLILDRDKRPEDEVHRVIEWATSDDFWKPNILSAVKLRSRYDQLRLSAERDQKARQPHQTQPSRLQQQIALRRAASGEAPTTTHVIEGQVIP